MGVRLIFCRKTSGFKITLGYLLCKGVVGEEKVFEWAGEPKDLLKLGLGILASWD